MFFRCFVHSTSGTMLLSHMAQGHVQRPPVQTLIDAHNIHEAYSVLMWAAPDAAVEAAFAATEHNHVFAAPPGAYAAGDTLAVGELTATVAVVLPVTNTDGDAAALVFASIAYPEPTEPTDDELADALAALDLLGVTPTEEGGA